MIRKENLDFIVEGLKRFISSMSKEKFYLMTKRHFQLLYLMDENGEWTLEELKKIQEELLPINYTADMCIGLLNRIIDANSDNRYLMDFLNGCNLGDFKRLGEKISEEGDVVIPDVIAYTLMLERLTRACSNDHKVFSAVIDRFRRIRKETGAFKALPTFHKLKLISIDRPAQKTIRMHTTRKINPRYGKYIVSINILEATIADYLKKNYGNSYAGKVLFNHPCGALEYDPRTGRGPSKWSDDGKIVQRVYPLPREWAELYQTWNMDFVTRFPDFPYLLPKLLIPVVSEIKKCPENYIYNRAIALNIYLNYASFDYIDKKKRNVKSIDWYDDKLNKTWGEYNRESAKSYATAVKRAKNKDMNKTLEG